MAATADGGSGPPRGSLSGRAMSGSVSSTMSGMSTQVHDAKSNAVHAIAKKIARHFPSVPVTNCTALRRAMEDPVLKNTVVVVDVRQREEVEVSRIPGSITSEEFEARKAEFKGKTVVCYCTVGYRSSAQAAKLAQQGFEAKNLEGGIVRWSQKHLPLVTLSGEGGQEQETKRVHVYGKDWALQPDDYEAVTFKSPLMTTLRALLPRWLGGK